jgi:SSS family solute:Na+ symporter
MASESITAARKTPIIGAFPKMFVPFFTILPGMLAAVLVSEIAQVKRGVAVPGGASGTGVEYNDAMLYLMRDLLPNGLLGLAIAGLLAAFMAGMAANVSAFNTVFTVDLWETYVAKDRPDHYYVSIGRLATVAAVILAIFTALIAAQFSNIMDYLQTLFGFFNAPLFATFILGMFWKKMTPTAGWVGLVMGTLTAVFVWLLSKNGVFTLAGQGTAFVAAAAGFVIDIVVSVLVSLWTKPKPAEELVGFVYSETPKSHFHDPKLKDMPWLGRPLPLAGLALVMVVALNFLF